MCDEFGRLRVAREQQFEEKRETRVRDFGAMAPMVLLLNASKVAGVLGAITVVANALTFRHFHRRNLAPFPDPVDETQEVLASFPIDKNGESLRG